MGAPFFNPPLPTAHGADQPAGTTMHKIPNEQLPLNGVEMIAAERKRQIVEKGYTPDHDDLHTQGELALVAALLASPDLLFKQTSGETGTLFTDPWPETWERRWDRRPYYDKNGRPNHDVDMGTRERIGQLQRAGALIAAEIDRLLRIQAGVAPRSSVKNSVGP